MNATGQPPVTWQVDERVLVVTIDNPPVNALSQSVRQGLLQVAEMLDGETHLGAMVLRSSGAVFVGGADIREFGGPRLDPPLNAVCDRLERCGKPVLSALQGAALGGGLEVALASHGRVAASAAVAAFPEVQLGLLPGAGGTQRAPRLCGAALALDLMLTGRRLAAADARTAGLIDVVDEDPVMYAMQWARRLIATPAPLRRSSAGDALRDADAQRAAIRHAMEQMPDDAMYRFARERIVRCVAAAVDQPYAAGAAVEAQAFLECLASPHREHLVQQFFAERAARKAERATQK
jgi:3-hydroxyacyl-CoA dehydrogenase